MPRLYLLGRVQLTANAHDSEVPSAVAPKPLGLLAYLVLAGVERTPLRRDTLVALFWPELSEPRARGVLRQALFQIRRLLGANAISCRDDAIIVDPDALWCDAAEFEACLAAGDRAGALELYHGELLGGFHIENVAPELEDWIERRRMRTRSAAARAARELAECATREERALDAERNARRALELLPDDEAALALLIGALDTLGDRTGALRAAARFSDQLAREYQTSPSPSTRALVDAVRARATTLLVSPPTVRREHEAEVTPPIETPPNHPERDVPISLDTAEPLAAPSLSRRRWHRASIGLASTAALVLAVAGAMIVRATGNTVHVETSPVQRPLLGLTISTPAARRLFIEGLARFDRGHRAEAARLFDDALAEDSSCAICAYYISQARRFDDFGSTVRAMQAAVRLAPGASPYEQLLIRYGWADVINDPSRVELARSLVIRYPELPEGEYAVGYSLELAGHFLDAVPHLRRAWHLDSLAMRGERAPCRACDAPNAILNSYWAADSLAAAERFARSWVRATPTSPLAWNYLSQALGRSGRYRDAQLALDSATARDSGGDGEMLERARLDIRAGDFGSADALLAAINRSGNSESRIGALWWSEYSLRNQGRLREALALARGQLRWEVGRAGHGAVDAMDYIEAQTLFELGRAADSRALFRSIATPRPLDAEFPTLGARRRAWLLTHVGTASAALGDTSDLAMLIDSVATIGKPSALGRDPLLHEYLRGLLYLARGQAPEAIDAFRRSILSYTEGFTRENLALATTLLQLDRAHEAIAVLESALHGPDDASNLYVTRSEIHEALARAFERAGEPDSAAAHYRAVADAWRRADPLFRARAVAAGQRAFELGERVRSRRVTNGTAIASSQRAEP